jgi:peptide/nickel transport system substrate-binding protein
MPRIWLKKAKGVRTWFDEEPYFVSLGIPMFYINATHRPVDDVRMRRAMAFAINYRDIRELAVSGYSKPLKPGVIIPYGPEAKYFSEEDAAKYGATYDPDKARAILKEAGYTATFGKDGELVETRDARGNKVPTAYIKSPTGWTDYESIVRIAVRSMRAVGIDVRERFIDGALYWPARYTGDFDLLLDMPQAEPSPAKPWSRLDFLLTSKEWLPEGEKAYKNYGRFNRPSSPDYEPRFDALLDLIPTLTDEKALVEAYREFNVLFMKYQPAIPVVYRPDQFYEVSVKQWTGFPTADNPYAPPQLPGDRLGTRMLWSIEPARSN